MDIKAPKQNLMPELGGAHGKNTLDLILNLVFRKAGPNEKSVRGLWVNYVRIVDQTIYEYHLARECMEEFVTTDNSVLSPLFRCSTHLENCIISIRKAINFARSIRRNQDLPHIPKMALLSDSGSKSIVDTRNMLEHLEEKLVKGELEEKSTIMLAPQEKYLSVGSIVITYEQLPSWLTELFKLAEAIKDYKPSRNA